MMRRAAAAVGILAAYSWAATAVVASDPDPIVATYQACLGRPPATQHAVDYWRRHPDPATGICTSPEARARNEARGLAWFSSSTWMPEVMLCIRWAESRDNYTVHNNHGRSSSSGAWQMVQSTSDEAARRMDRPDLIGVSANRWTRVEQDRGAAHVLQFQGLTAWTTYQGCK